MAAAPEDFTCVNCGDAVRPFGTMRHWFGDDNHLICIKCARTLMPERVAIAEAFEAEWNQPDAKPGQKPE